MFSAVTQWMLATAERLFLCYLFSVFIAACFLLVGRYYSLGFVTFGDVAGAVLYGFFWPILLIIETDWRPL